MTVTAQNLAKLGLCALAFMMAGLFIVHWDYYFTGDAACAGLQGLSILKYGDRPIFLFRIGYQGALEFYLLAALFYFFDTSMTVLRGVPSFFLLLLLPGYFICIRKQSGERVALLATLFLIVSTPYFYAYTAAAYTYSLTYACGFALFNLYETLRSEKSKAWHFAAFGFVAGFSVYTFRVVLFFIIAIAVHAVLTWRKKIARRDAALVLILAAVGFLPQVIYALTPTAPPSIMKTPFSALVFIPNLQWAGRFAMQFLNVAYLDALNSVLLVFYICAVVWAFRRVRFTPLTIFPFVVLGLFCFSERVSVDAGRYFLPILFFLCWATAKALCDIKLRSVAVVLAALILFNNGAAFVMRFKKMPPRILWNSYIAKLDELKIDRAYANFWLAYPVTYLTRERIIVEPLADNYSPHYGAQVAEASRIAVVLRGRSLDDVRFGDHVQIRGVDYDVEQSIWMPGTPFESVQDIAGERLIRLAGYSIHVLARR